MVIHLGRDASEGDAAAGVIREVENSCDTWQRVTCAVKTLQFESVPLSPHPLSSMNTHWMKDGCCEQTIIVCQFFVPASLLCN